MHLYTYDENDSKRISKDLYIKFISQSEWHKEDFFDEGYSFSEYESWVELRTNDDYILYSISYDDIAIDDKENPETVVKNMFKNIKNVNDFKKYVDLVNEGLSEKYKKPITLPNE